MLYKVPLRQVYTQTFKDWLKSTIWCHLVLKLFPFARDLGSDSLLPTYIDHPDRFYEQYESTLIEANQERLRRTK